MIFRCFLVQLPLVTIIFTKADCGLLSDLIGEPDKCLHDGFFCFNVKSTSHYSHYISPNDTDVLLSMVLAKSSSDRPWTHAWEIRINDSIQDTRIIIDFQSKEKKHSCLKLMIQRSIKRQVMMLDVYKLQHDEWLLQSGRQRNELVSVTVVSEHMISFRTSESFSQLIKLETSNLTMHLVMRSAMERPPFRNKVDITTQEVGTWFASKSSETHATIRGGKSTWYFHFCNVILLTGLLLFFIMTCLLSNTLLLAISRTTV